MDWANEYWIKLYTRRSLDWKALPWDARAIFNELLKVVDRFGRIALGQQGLKGLAAELNCPPEKIHPAIAALTEAGSVAITEGILTLPNFIEAQDAQTSTAERQRRYRKKWGKYGDRKPLKSHKMHVTESNAYGNAVSRDVTRCNDQIRLDQTRRDQDQDQKHGSPPEKPAGPPKPQELVFAHWQKVRSKTGPMVKEDFSVIGARLKEGFSIEQLCQAADGVGNDPWAERATQDEIKFVYGNAGQVRKFIDLAVKGTPREKPKDGYYRAENYRKRPPPGEVEI